MVAIAVMLLRRRDPGRPRVFRVPALPLLGTTTILGCAFLFFNLPTAAMLVLPIWSGIGLLIYFGYSRRRSHLGQGLVEVTDVTEGYVPSTIAATD
jgi:APA family basic amino acid/polyamine antiporter